MYIDYRTYVCYNIRGATLFGRRLAFATGVYSLCLHRYIHLRKSITEVCAYAYNGTFYSHHQLMHNMLCSWLCRWL